MNKLKEFREKKDWTQGKLAEESGVSRVTINQIENGKAHSVKTDTLVKLADALCEKVSTIFFCEESLTCCTSSSSSSDVAFRRR